MAQHDHSFSAFSGAELGWKTSRCHRLRPGCGWGRSTERNQGSRRHYYRTVARLSRVGTFRLSPISKPKGWPDVITVFLRSLAQNWDGKLVAVIVSGLDAMTATSFPS